MRKRKSLSLVLRLSLPVLIVTGQVGCMPLFKKDMSAAQFQRGLDLIDQGTLLMRAERLDEAQGAFAAASELGSMAAAIDGLGCVAFMRKDFSLAEKYFVEAYEIDNNYNTSLGNLALLYEVNGLSDKASRLFVMALEAEPDNFRTRNNFAVHLFDKDSRGRAKLELLKALALAKHPIVAGNLMRLEEYE